MILHLIGMAGLFGYGLMTGRFQAEKRQQYLATWKGEKLVPYVEEVVEEVVEESPLDATARILGRQLSREVIDRELQRQLELMKDMKITLDEAQKKLEADRLSLVKQEEDFTKKIEEQKKGASEEGFLKALQTYSQMNPKYVKDDFMVMDDKEVVRILAAMKPGIRTEVLSKFREPQEQVRRVKLVALLRDSGVIDVE